MAQPLTLAKLSSLSTSTLSSILELTRAHQLSLPATQLITTIARNLATLNNGIAHLHHQGQQGEPLKALEAQYDRLVNLVTPLGVDVPPQAQPQGKTGRLVDTGDEDDDDDLVAVGGEEGGFALGPVSGGASHTAVNMSGDNAEATLDQLEEDEDEMRRANSEVLQMQRRMLDDQDETLDSLSSAIARQHSLSINIASELEAQSALLDETDEAMERTDSSLRRASGRLNQFTRKAKDTGSTGLIVLLVVVLVFLIVLFK